MADEPPPPTKTRAEKLLALKVPLQVILGLPDDEDRANIGVCITEITKGYHNLIIVLVPNTEALMDKQIPATVQSLGPIIACLGNLNRKPIKMLSLQKHALHDRPWNDAQELFSIIQDYLPSRLEEVLMWGFDSWPTEILVRLLWQLPREVSGLTLWYHRRGLIHEHPELRFFDEIAQKWPQLAALTVQHDMAADGSLYLHTQVPHLAYLLGQLSNLRTLVFVGFLPANLDSLETMFRAIQGCQKLTTFLFSRPSPTLVGFDWTSTDMNANLAALVRNLPLLKHLELVDNWVYHSTDFDPLVASILGHENLTQFLLRPLTVLPLPQDQWERFGIKLDTETENQILARLAMNKIKASWTLPALGPTLQSSPTDPTLKKWVELMVDNRHNSGSLHYLLTEACGGRGPGLYAHAAIKGSQGPHKDLCARRGRTKESAEHFLEELKKEEKLESQKRADVFKYRQSE